MAPYHKLIVIIGSVVPENLVLLTKSEQFGPKSAHICPTTVDTIILLQHTYWNEASFLLSGTLPHLANIE